MKILFLIILLSTCAHAFEWDYKTSKSQEDLKVQSWKPVPNKGNILSREFEGFAEYRTYIKDDDLSAEKQIYLGKIGDADKVYLNGTQIGQTGNFPPAFSYNMDTERAYFLPKGMTREGLNELRVLVYSKFLVNKGFDPKNFKIDYSSNVDAIKYTGELSNNLYKIIIPVLCLVLAVVSFPLLAPKHLWNSQVMIFLIGLWSFILGICRGRILYHYFDMLSVYKLTLASSILTIWLVSVFMTKHCKSKIKFLPTIVGASLLTAFFLSNSLVEAASLARIWFHVSPLFLLFALYGCFKSQKSFFRLTGLIVLLITNINDNLNDLRIISTTSLLQTGLGTFISCMIIDQLLSLKRSWESFFMREAQLEIDAAVGKQAIQIAHDLRSPIEAIGVAISNIQEIPKDDEISLRSGLRRINEICDSLLHQSQLNTSSIHSVDKIIESIKEVTKEVSYKHTQKELSIMFSLGELRRDLSFEVDSALLKRTICNLLTNSIEACNFKGEVYISLSSQENFIKIEIQDNGTGIPTESSQLFERGFTTKVQGNGLGLSSAKAFIESNGGMITLSRLHQGTLVSRMIPASSNSISMTQKNKKNIVLIDDDSLVRFNWKRQGLAANISVHTFETLEDFLEVRTDFNFDTPIFIDSNLGQVKGEIVSKKLVHLGYRNISLTTGAPEKSISNRQWISNIVGKSFEAAVLGH